jgi:hypothetical protein
MKVEKALLTLVDRSEPKEKLQTINPGNISQLFFKVNYFIATII